MTYGAKSKHYLYSTWKMMKSRFNNSKHQNYRRYGGRGISVCQRWQDSFWDFVSDMGIRPPNHSIDRIDNDGNYHPNNCRWADKKTQTLNRSYKTRATRKHLGSAYRIRAHRMQRDPLKCYASPAKAGPSKISPDVALAIYKEYELNTVIAKKYNVSVSTVGNIKCGDTWQHLTGHKRTYA